MYMNCPKGWKKITKVSNTAFENREVNICGGICDRPDLCKIKDCEHYDISKEGHRKFMDASLREHTLEGYIELREKKAAMKKAIHSEGSAPGLI